MPDEIILLGKSPNWEACPFDKPVMTFPCEFVNTHKIDYCIDVHVPSGGSEFLQNDSVHYITFVPLPNGKKNYELYPLKGVYDAFNSLYFTSSVAWAIAYCLYKGVKKMYLYGVDFSSDIEIYTYQRQNAEYWIGYATAKGMEVIIPETSELLRLPEMNNIMSPWSQGVYGLRMLPDNVKQIYKLY
jgi:hypothetical protein